MKIPGKMDQLASDLASGKVKIHEDLHSPEKKKLALLVKTHEDESKRHNRAAEDAMTLAKYHRGRGEHELADIHTKIAEPLKTAATLHKKLVGIYNKRHGAE